jgi:rubrerythrin
MDIFDFAMKMEKDGQAFYEKMARQTDNAPLKNILLDLARDESIHYETFKLFKEGDMSAASKMDKSQTKTPERAKNVFQQMASKKEKLNFGADVITGWREAQKIEKKSEDFYREKAKEEKNEKIKKTILMIANEEHKHWALIENVLQFLNRPKQWLEDAEWNNLDEY